MIENTRLHQMGEDAQRRQKKITCRVTWRDYVKGVRNLEMCAIDFSCWVEILARRLGATRITCYVRWEWGRIGMTLRSLETYGYIGSKTKSYRIQKGFFLLFIFLGHLSDRIIGLYVTRSYLICHQTVHSSRMPLSGTIRP